MSSGNKGKPKGSLKAERSDKPLGGAADKPSDKSDQATEKSSKAAEKAGDRGEKTAASKTSVESARAALAETELSSEKAAAAAASRQKHDAKAAFYIPADHPWNQAWKIFAAVAMIGIAMSAFAWTTDPQRFAFSYLTAFAWGITLALGGMFFVILQHITRSGWSVVIRRAAEHLMMSLPVFALLFIPIWFFKESLYPWAVHGGEHSHAIEAKKAFLNVPFWTVRAVVYFAIWSFVAYRLSSLSRQQDESGDPQLTIKMEGFSFPALVLFGFTSSFGVGIDWLMSLEPGWYSTIFGVWIPSSWRSQGGPTSASQP